MKFETLPLAGAFVITLDRLSDARGFFARSYCADEFAAAGLNTTWVQMNLSHNVAAGTLRGLHFQRPPAGEVKMVRCLRGRALDVILDMRDQSPSRGRWISLELDADAHNAIYLPQGFAHGFQTLTDDTQLQYMHSTAYAPGVEDGVNPLDDDLAITWPLPPRNLSPRDAALPDFKDCMPL